jgi:hypothetical protein
MSRWIEWHGGMYNLANISFISEIKPNKIQDLSVRGHTRTEYTIQVYSGGKCVAYPKFSNRQEAKDAYAQLTKQLVKHNYETSGVE